VAGIVFLALNGVALQASEDDLEKLVRRVATGQRDKSSAAVFLRANSP